MDNKLKKRMVQIKRPQKNLPYGQSATPTMTAIQAKHYRNGHGFKLNGNRIDEMPPIILSEDDEVHSSENKIMKISLHSSSDDSTSDDGMHSDDEKCAWQDVGQVTPDFSFEDDEN